MSDEDEALDELIARLPPDERDRLEQIREQGKEKGRLFHQQLTLVFGTLGAIAFAGLVLVMQDPSPFEHNGFPFLTPHQNFDVVVLALSVTILLALLSCIPTSMAAAGIVKMLGPVGKFGYATGLLSIVFLVLSILIMIGDVTPAGAYIFITALIVVLLAMLIAFSKEVGFRSLFPW
jgi:hypothetical protein